MLDVFFTVDVEVWCDSWDDMDRQFPDAFRKYVYGPTSLGGYALPYTLDLLTHHGLLGTFFVESLFTARFGNEPLAEIVGLIAERKQEIQLHVHTEWADESRHRMLENTSVKRRYLRDFDLEEQKTLIQAGAAFLKAAGAKSINAFRAGSFGFNTETLMALAANGIEFDSSYNARTQGSASGLMPGVPIVEPVRCHGVFEYPVTAYHDGTHRLRPVQVTACSFDEMEGLLWQALEKGRKAFVIVSHNFELLNEAKSRPDYTVVHRFRKLCAFLDRHRDCFHTRGFRGLQGTQVDRQPAPLTSPFLKTAHRMVEQGLRRRYA